MTLRPLAAALLLAPLALAGCGDSNDAPPSATRPAPTPGAPSAVPDASAAPMNPSDGAGASAPAAATASRGQELYGRFCAACHGPDGHGDGAMASMLKVKPRSFAEEAWTHIGKGIQETDRAGIIRVVNFGIPEAGMTPFGPMLKPEDVEAVADYVLELRAKK